MGCQNTSKKISKITFSHITMAHVFANPGVMNIRVTYMHLHDFFRNMNIMNNLENSLQPGNSSIHEYPRIIRIL